MKNLYPTYRGKDENGNVTMDMVDRFGRTWATGVGEDRVQAQYAARRAMPPKGVIRSVLSYAKSHPIKAALLTATAYHTYASYASIRDGRSPGMTLKQFLVASAIAYIGIKVIGMFIKNDE